MHSSVCHWRRIWGRFEQFLQHFLHISSLKREQKLCLDWFWEESYFSVATASTEQSERDRTCLWLSCHAFGFYNERPGWRVDTSRPESVCHRHRRRKRRENIRSRFDLYCVSLKDFHQSVIEPRLVFDIWSDESTSFSKFSLQRVVITVQKWTTRTTCLAQERQDNLGKFTPRCKQFPSSVAV